MLTQFDKENFEQLPHKNSFFLLQPSSEAFEIIIPQKDLFIQISEKKRIRRVYYKVPLSEEQRKSIGKVRQLLEKGQIDEKFYSSQTILKHFYESDLKADQCFERIKNVSNFLQNKTISTYNSRTQSQLKQGYIYTFGRDKGMKPIVVVQMRKFDFSKNIEENFNCVYFLMLLVLGVQTVPYHAEKYTSILDFTDVCIRKIPFKALLDVFKYMNLCYCGNLERTIIYNAYGFTTLWYFIKGLIPEYARKMIYILNDESKSELLDFIDADQLETKFGGNLANLSDSQYWPPRVPSENKITPNTSMSKRQSDTLSCLEEQYYSVNNDSSFFQEEEDFCGKARCSCRIF